MNPDRLLKVSRLEALTDGIFAIAMTILVLNVTVPHNTSVAAFLPALEASIVHKLFIYAGSFIILGTQWIGMDFQHGFLVKVDRPYLWVNIFFLMFLCVVPFSASLVASYPHFPISIYFYAINLILLNVMQLIMWHYAQSYHLNSTTAKTLEINRSILRRIYIAPIFYILSMLLSHWHTGVAFLALILPPLIHSMPGAVDKYTLVDKYTKG